MAELALRLVFALILVSGGWLMVDRIIAGITALHFGVTN